MSPARSTGRHIARDRVRSDSGFGDHKEQASVCLWTWPAHSAWIQVIQRLFSVDHARLIAEAGIGNSKGGQRAMAFIQIMQLQTSKVDEMRAAGDEWDKATEGKRTVQRSLICED